MTQINEDLLSWIVNKLVVWSDRKADLRDIHSGFWTYRFNSYEEAIKYLDTLTKKYSGKTDTEMASSLSNAYMYAKSYFHKG